MELKLMIKYNGKEEEISMTKLKGTTKVVPFSFFIDISSSIIFYTRIEHQLQEKSQLDL